MLTTKGKPPGRADDPYLSDKLIAEREGIFLWCLEGLHRLLVNNYRFIISDQARENISVVVRGATNNVYIGGGKRCLGHVGILVSARPDAV